MTDAEVLEYRRKLADRDYVNKAVHVIAGTEIIRYPKPPDTTKIIRRGRNMKNGLIDLHNHLFEQLERLNDDSLSNEELKRETLRAKAMTSVSSQIIANCNLMVKAHTIADANEAKLPQLMLKDNT